MVSPGLDPGFHQSDGGSATTALIQLNDIVYLPYIKISYFFTNVLMTRITSLHWIRTRTPALGIQGGIHYTTDTEGYYISLNIYFWLRKGKKEPANFTGSNPTVSTTANTTQGTELLCWTATTFWVWQISKSANCKLHPLSYLYMHRSRWLVCPIYSCHWRPLFPLWCNIPAHAPGHL